MAYDWRTLFIPIAAGLNTESDPRALEPPGLAVCKNAEFIEIGGLQTRYPFLSIGTNIKGGGTISNIRRICEYANELLAFTEDTLYSWSEADTAWVSKGTHLAAEINEHPVFVDPSEQVLSDKCEIGNLAIYTWVKRTSSADVVYVAAIDTATGNVVLQPTNPDDGAVDAVTRPRLVPLASNALLFFVDGTDRLCVIDLNPSTLAADLATTATQVLASVDGPYDACRNAAGTSAYVVVAATTNYEVALVSSTAAITTTANKVRAADGPICVAASPGATRIMVGRVVDNGTATPDVRGDILNATTLANVSVNVLVGTIDAGGNGPINQITAAYRSAQVGGQWTCYLFWTHDEQDAAAAGTAYFTRKNTLNDAATIGTEANLLARISLASRAFDHDGRVYFWGVYALSSSGISATGSLSFRAQLQNSYFLYRDDGFLVAKAARSRAGGFSQSEGHLPGVHSTASNVYSWCGAVRRVFSISEKQTNYAARAPQDIEVTFDSNKARRTVQLGRTLYITGGEILQYDGRALAEVGWHLFPWRFLASDSGGAGNLGAGTYTYGATFCHENAVGELDRSAMVSTDDATLAASRKATIQVTGSLAATHRTDGWIDMWRTTANPVADAPLRLVTSNDPSVTSVGDNGYFPNTDSTYLETDNFSDTTLLKKESFEQSGSALEHLAPPAATIIAATHERLFLAGIADNPYQVWYSLQREEGTVASFHDALTIEVPPTAGVITGLAFLDGILIVFCEHGIWSLPGDGLDDTGGGQNYGPARLVSGDVGATSHDSIALTPRGLAFQSSKGIYLMGDGLDPVGRRVADFTEEIVAAHVMEDKHQVRLLSSARMLVWDYRVNEWSEWTISSGVSACVWQGVHHYATASAVNAEQSAYGTDVTYALDVELAWIPVGVGGKLGQGKVGWFELLGEVISACDVRIQVARNYASTTSGATFFHSKYWPVSPATAGGPLQVRHAPSIRPMHAIKVRITTYATGSTTNPPTGGGIKLTGLALQVGLERGLWRMLASAQKQ